MRKKNESSNVNKIRFLKNFSTDGGPIVLGVDPSIVKTGVVLMQDKSLLATMLIKPGKDLGTDTDARITFIASVLKKNILDVFQPDSLFIETQYSARNIGMAINLSKLRGFIQGFFYYSLLKNISIVGFPPIVNVNPKSAKAVMGVPVKIKREESKDMVRKMALRLYPELEGESEDVIDALSIALAGYSKVGLRPKTRFRST